MLALTLLSGHVAPAVDDNNRYVKLTPLGDRVRIAYTVFYGEIPGAALRRMLDINGDGRIDDAEARAFGTRVGAELAPRMTLAIDGTEAPVTWASIDAGLGTPDVDAGAFSLDLVAFACLPTARGEHRVRFVDRFELDHPGETEVRVESSPGVTVLAAHVGNATDPTFDFRFAGPDGPIATDGLELTFVAGPHALVTADGRCPARATSASGDRVRLIAIIAATAASALLAAIALIRARRRRAAPGA